MWYGNLNNIPTGWALCNGENGTPDLRDRFITGAGNTYPVDDTGGLVQHNHGFTGDGHIHDLESGDNILAGENYEPYTEMGVTNGNTDNESSLSPYHALAYIMEL